MTLSFCETQVSQLDSPWSNPPPPPHPSPVCRLSGSDPSDRCPLMVAICICIFNVGKPFLMFTLSFNLHFILNLLWQLYVKSYETMTFFQLRFFFFIFRLVFVSSCVFCKVLHSLRVNSGAGSLVPTFCDYVCAPSNSRIHLIT